MSEDVNDIEFGEVIVWIQEIEQRMEFIQHRYNALYETTRLEDSLHFTEKNEFHLGTMDAGAANTIAGEEFFEGHERNRIVGGDSDEDLKRCEKELDDTKETRLIPEVKKQRSHQRCGELEEMKGEIIKKKVLVDRILEAENLGEREPVFKNMEHKQKRDIGGMKEGKPKPKQLA